LEKERQEHEEYLKLKAAFSVEEEGYEEGGGDEEQNSLLQEFINYIKVLNSSVLIPCVVLPVYHLQGNTAIKQFLKKCTQLCNHTFT
jgi:DDRGK domain.